MQANDAAYSELLGRLSTGEEIAIASTYAGLNS